MARMFPDVPKPATQSAAESKLYSFFKRNLSEDFVVYHSVSYVLSGGRTRRPRCGEADFVVVHRELGLLVVEVKGGRVGFDPKCNRWESIGRKGPKRIKDPFQQAETCLDNIREAIRRSGLLDERTAEQFSAYCVALPDCQVAGTPLSAWGRADIVIDRSHLGDLQQRVVGIMRSRAPRARPLTTGTFRALQQQVLARYFDLGLRLTGEIEWEKQALAQLTEDQSVCLDFLEVNPRCMVRGTAGTGKTLIALEHVHRLASQGGRVLFVCYNLPLADYLRKAVGARENWERIWAGAYHELCREWAQRAGLEWCEPDDREQKSAFWDTDTTLLLLEAQGTIPERFDHLVVDEAQDMHRDWWPALFAMLRDPDRAHIVAFCDPLQNIYQRPESYPITSPVFPLRTNCRNTRRICEFLAKLLDIRQRQPVLGAPGGKPVVRRYRTDAEQVEQLERDVHTLIHDRNVRPEKIVLLGTHRLERSCLAGIATLAGCPVVETNRASDAATGGLRYSTLHRYKGLEADIVLFCDLDGNSLTCTPRHIYVGASRARHRLYLYVHEGFSLPTDSGGLEVGPHPPT